MTASATSRDTRAKPDFALETAARARLGPEAIVAGIDEVGRGPLAGPVVAAAAVLSERAAAALSEARLDDSKKLPVKRRAALADQIRALAAEGALSIALGAASVGEIDDLGIAPATERAMARALHRLTRQLDRAPALALVDGKHAPRLPVPVEMVIGGDGRSLSIAAAALLAKVTRDRAMARLDVRHPAFGWATNAGYGAARHRDAIRAHGVTAHHRALFCRRVLAEAAAANSSPIASRR